MSITKRYTKFDELEKEEAASLLYEDKIKNNLIQNTKQAPVQFVVEDEVNPMTEWDMLRSDLI